MTRLQTVCTTLILSIACSMPAMVSGGTLTGYDNVGIEIQSFDPACGAKAVENPGIDLLFFHRDFPQILLNDPVVLVTCFVGAGLNGDGQNIRWGIEVSLINPRGATEMIGKGRGKTGGDGISEIKFDVPMQTFGNVFPGPSQDGRMVVDLDVRRGQKVDRLCLGCELSFCASSDEICLDPGSIDLSRGFAFTCACCGMTVGESGQ